MLCADRLRLRATDTEQAKILASALEVSPTLAQLLWQRGLDTPDRARAFLEEGAETALDPFLLKDMDRAVELLEEALANRDPILVHGDYDVDGVSATVLLVEALADLGGHVVWHVPDRFTEGYGVSLGAVEHAAADGVRLLLTADCGSSARLAVERAHELGMRVIVTDHHQLAPDPPQPDAFLNPQRADCEYPNKSLCGTGVAYKLACALYSRRNLPWPQQHLDLVALATIADVVTLRDENRAMVRTGLERLARTERPGLVALAQLAGLAEGPWGSFAVGFGLGPRINAAGRLDTARRAVELLLCQDPEECRRHAAGLETLNQQRRAIEKAMRTEVEARLEENPELLEAGLVLEAGEDWHQGVVGITASRIVDRYGVPAFIMSSDGQLARGSARSPENVDLHQAMGQCSDLFVKWGGHARAAGFTVEVEKLPELRERLSQAVAAVRQGPAPVRADLVLPLHQATLQLARELSRLEPLGEGNRKPLFLAERVRLEQVKAIGADGDHLRLFAVQGSSRRKAVAFRQASDLEALDPQRLYYDVLFQLDVETWEGTTGVSLVVEALLEPPPPLVAWLRGSLPGAGEGPQFLDLRPIIDRAGYLQRLLQLAPETVVVVGHPRQIAPTLERLGGTARVCAFGSIPAGAADIVVLSPPRDLESLRQPELWGAERVHLLFGDRELEQEERRHRESQLDRPRLETIWRTLQRSARSGRIHPRELPRIEPNQGLLQAALGVLEELGLATWEESDAGRMLLLSRGAGRRLEESERFAELRRRGQQFATVRRMFRERELRLAERLRGA